MAAVFENVFGSIYPKEVVDLQIFHKVTKVEAEEIVKKYNKGPGTYLLRPSEAGKQTNFSITTSLSEGCSKAKIRHLRVSFNLCETLQGRKIEYFVSRTLRFQSIEKFLQCYSQTPIPCDGNIKVTLQCGIGRQQKSIFKLPFHKRAVRRYSEPECNIDLEPPVGSAKVSRSSTGTTRTQSFATDLRPRLPIRFASERNVPVAACSAAAPTPPSNTPPLHIYNNISPEDQNAHVDPKKWPALPIPIQDDKDTYVPTYYVVDPNRNFFQEQYEFLKEIEMCECGLRMKSAILPEGWSVHKTSDAIFFQHGVEETQWELPDGVAQLLTESQIYFMVDLCAELDLKIPNCVVQAQAALGACSAAPEACSEKDLPDDEEDMDMVGYEVPNPIRVEDLEPPDPICAEDPEPPKPAPRRISFNTASDRAFTVSATPGAPSGTPSDPHDTSRHS